MDQKLIRDIKSIFRTTQKRSCYRTTFERKLVQFIQKRAPEDSVHWEKLRYELHHIYRVCRDKEKSLKIYLSAVCKLTDAALEGRHKQVELDRESLKIK